MPADSKEEATPARPAFVDRRIELFEQFRAEHEQVQAALPRKEIKVKFGESETTATAFETNVYQAAKAAKVDKKVINRALCAIVRDPSGEPLGVVNGQWDLERPLEQDCSVELCDFESEARCPPQPRPAPLPRPAAASRSTLTRRRPARHQPP